MEKQDLAINRLLKKLSALRATLKGDERDLLDGFVLGASDEVSAHGMKVIPISPARSMAKSMSADEAKAMSLKVSSAKTMAKAMTPDEAKAMGLKVNKTKNMGKVVDADEVAAHSLSVKIVFNPNNDEYQRVS